MGGGGQLWDCFGGVRLCLGCVWEAVLIRGYSVFGEGGGVGQTQLGLVWEVRTDTCGAVLWKWLYFGGVMTPVGLCLGVV